MADIKGTIERYPQTRSSNLRRDSGMVWAKSEIITFPR